MKERFNNMVNSKKINLSELYKNRIQAMHKSKIEYNRKKLKKYGGSYNTDDHGFICFDDFKFEPEYNRDNIIYGCRLIGKNLRKFLASTPSYIHPDSALAGCWAGFLASNAKIGLRPSDRPEHLYEIHKKYGIIQTGIGAMNHLGPDMTIGLKSGYKGLLEKVRYYREFNAPSDTDFYDGEEELLLGLIEYINRHSEYAFTLAEKEEDPFKRDNYMEIGRINKNLTESPPATFKEACQFIAHFQSIDRVYFAGGALGQLDELLRPYYEKDIKNGILTDEIAVWVVASLFYNDTHYSQIGGVTPDGSRDLTSRMSFIILEAMHQLHIPANIAVRVHDNMNGELMRRAVEYILEDNSGVSFSLSHGIEEGYSKNGHPLQLSRMRAKVGCNWVALPGIEYPLQDVCKINFGWAFYHALNDVTANRERFDLSKDEKKLEYLWERFSYHLKIMVDCIKEGYDHHYEVVSRNLPEIVLNLFCHGPLERGLNAAEGGVDILNFNIDGMALATVADSFAAVEQRVVMEKHITWDEMYRAVSTDFKESEDTRLMLANIPRFGNPYSKAEDWAKKIRDIFVEYVKMGPTPKHRLNIIPGLFSHGDIQMYGKDLPATPNGRKSGEPISHSSEPDPGFAKGLSSFSPTLKANAVAYVQAGYGNSAPLHLDIDSDMIKKEGGVDALIALIHTHNKMGGTLINLNCITKEQIMKAHEDPESYPDLVVRVTGYSAFFASLSKEYRQQVVDRYLTE